MRQVSSEPRQQVDKCRHVLPKLKRPNARIELKT